MPCHAPKYPYPNSHDNLCPDPNIRKSITDAAGGLECVVCAEQKAKEQATDMKAAEAAVAAKPTGANKPNGANKENVKNQG